MEPTDEFWQLKGATKIESADDFYDLLEKADHLKNALYFPDELEQMTKGYTTRIVNKRFERVSFSKTRISGVIFRNCVFEKCLFIGSDIENCEFHGCRFLETNTHKISISGTYIDPSSFNKCLDRKKHQNIGVHLYQQIFHNCRSEEQIEFEREAQFLFLRWKRYQDGYFISEAWRHRSGLFDFKSLKLVNRLIYLRRWAWEWAFGAGIRIRYFLTTVLLVIAFTTFLNYTFSEHFGLARAGAPISDVWEALYYSTISLTTLGYGDIVPTTSVGLIAATIQSVAGFVLFAMFAAMLIRRVTP